MIGICLGMQLLYEKSFEYGEYDGILKFIKEDSYVYFVHSYYANSSNKELVAFAEYEKKIPGIVRKDNVYGIQFHPEKSGKVGENILKAYKELIVKWEDKGSQFIHIVSLNGAKGEGNVNDESIKKILKTVNIPIQIGGGIREEKSVSTQLCKIYVCLLLLLVFCFKLFSSSYIHHSC